MVVQEQKNTHTGVVIMTYGSATTSENVRAYFESIYARKAPEELIKDFENRYRLVGGSPLIRITNEQAHLLEKKLNGDNLKKEIKNKYTVRAGMRHSAPKIADAVLECRKEGAENIIGIILSPQFSSVIMEGYRTSFQKAVKEAGYSENNVIMVGPWAQEKNFIELLALRIKKSLTFLPEKYGKKIGIIFTTHSLPASVVARDPAYLDQLKLTIDAVRKKLGDFLNGYDWYAAYQSAGHTPQAWLKPDLTDILDMFAGETIKEKKEAVLIVPIQFLADHLEILYDLDICAKQQCKERGIAYERIELPNTDPLFVEALASIVTFSCES